MRRKSIISLVLILTSMLAVSACGNKQKTTVLTNDVKQEATMQENEIKKFIAEGTDFLNRGKYDDARSTFEKAISMDKANKGAYIEIKNKYMEKQRLDDAYYIIKLAINNNVDTENMKKLLNDIKSKFEVTKIDASVYQNKLYNLPTKIKAKINNEEKEVDVVWNNKSVDTSKLGSIKYQGKIEKYDRMVELNLKVVKIKKVKKIENKKKTKKIGEIKRVYETNGKRYLEFDKVEFFKNKDDNDRTAEKEAIKDGKGNYLQDGKIYDNYYIRYGDKNLTTYEISPNVQIFVCGYAIKLNTIDLQKISYEKFKTLDANDVGLRLFYIYLEDNVVVKMEQQFIP